MIRPATADDAAAVREVVFAVLREFDLEPDPDDTDADLFDLPTHYFDRDGLFAVLELEGRVVGTVGLYRLAVDHVELRKMYLLPEQRGMGWGRRLAEYALQAAKRLGYARVSLETADRLVAAIALYRKLGFREEGAPRGCAARCDRTFVLDFDA